MRIVFMGTDNIALPSFKRLLDTMDVVGLVTQPDRPVGRRQMMTPPAIKILAEEADVPVFQPESLKEEGALGFIEAWKPDLIVVMAYGQILPERLINMASYGCINVHASLLPRHRGASCVASAIKCGDKETGITIINVTKRLDAGDMVKSAGFSLFGKETAGFLYKALGDFAPNVLMDAIQSMIKGTVVPVRQDEGLATYAPKLKRKDGEINWSDDALGIERMIRAHDPWPGTYTMFKGKKGRMRTLKIFPYVQYVEKNKGVPGEVVSINEKGVLIACGKGCLLLFTVQPDGGRKMPVLDFVKGYGLAVGMRLGVSDGGDREKVEG